MGEQHNAPFQLSFNSSLRVDSRGSRVTSDGGLMLVRELEERLGMGALIEQHLTDTRRGRHTPFPLADWLRQSVDSRLAGDEEVNDAERVSADPTVRLIGSETIWERGAALTSRWHAFEMEVVTGGTLGEKRRWHGSKGGTWVYPPTKPGDHNGNPGLQWRGWRLGWAPQKSAR